MKTNRQNLRTLNRVETLEASAEVCRQEVETLKNENPEKYKANADAHEARVALAFSNAAAARAAYEASVAPEEAPEEAPAEDKEPAKKPTKAEKAKAEADKEDA